MARAILPIRDLAKGRVLAPVEFEMQPGKNLLQMCLKLGQCRLGSGHGRFWCWQQPQNAATLPRGVSAVDFLKQCFVENLGCFVLLVVVDD